MPRFSRSLAVAALLVAALTAPAAHASSRLLTGIADDGVTQRSPALGASVIPAWRADGIDVARVAVLWSYVAPTPKALAGPPGFHAEDPNDPQYHWGDVDRTIGELVAAGIKPIITVTGPAPIWGSSVPSRRMPSYKPDPVKFAQFARAVAERFAASVDEYVLWNEPNIAQWLQPQSDCTSRGCTPQAPALYRAIAAKAIPAIKAGDPGAQVLFPALASGGKTPNKRNNDLKPLTFLRALGCVDATYRAERKSPFCRSGFKPINGDGIAYHPHSRTASPDKAQSDSDSAAFGDLARLFGAVDRIQKAGGFLNDGSKTRKFSFAFTEFGYQTNPPDPVLGVSLSNQSAYVQHATYMAWKNPRVTMLIQYLWRDDAVGAGNFSGWQSGMFGFDGRPKPLAAAFPNPFWVDLPRGKRAATIWGQVRPGDAAQVTVQARAADSSTWKAVKTLATDARGFFTITSLVRAKTSYRFRYQRPAIAGKPGTVTSSVWTVSPVTSRR